MKLILTILMLAFAPIILGQKSKKDKNKNDEDYWLKSDLLSDFQFRSIGPAFMSGRIADIAIDPKNENCWLVAAGSGGVWKTENNGTTWNSVFEGQGSYSIGCVTIDPANSNVLWVGTGENVGGRHIGYGDGIYKSVDGGKSWKNMGLKSSEHLSKIIIHPTNSNIVWVASQGPLWSKGGERGIYKSTDGGQTWKRTLGDDEWVGATDLVIDPRNADIMIAATWQRHRTVAGYMGGGPGTALYKSTDGGDSWTKLKSGLPSSNLGKIGLAISPINPDYVYAAIELDRRKGGVYRSTDNGESWSKMSDAVSGGTGPHYYQELYASPHKLDRLYLMNNYLLISEDGGKNFVAQEEKNKHVDNHAIAFKKNDPNYLLVGCDGGLYETFDHTNSWKFIRNLPLTQFYKIAVDDALPFYNVIGGTQDNNTQGGPSQTDNNNGIRNSDWFVVLGGDGHQPATEPGNPNIVYAQWQQGNLTRHDRLTGQNVYIQPQPKLGEKTERYNWDSPVLVSPHSPTRLYFCSQRVWKSEDRGDTWTAISGDLTTNTPRTSTPYFGKSQGWNNAWDIYAMSNYSTITSISESPKKQGLLYVGTDDGIVQMTPDNGTTWTKISLENFPGLPNTAFVNDIKADLHDENKVYAVFDNHKYGDYEPYLYASTDQGKTWKKITQGIPERTLVWRIVQDHIKAELLFLGTEFGVYTSLNQGEQWVKLSNGMPTISVRDLAIQKRENDLVAGTFGRGIYILDNYAALRGITEKSLENEASLFQPKDGRWYMQRSVLGGRNKASQGDDYFVAENPDFGVRFQYYLKEKRSSLKELREKEEAENEKEGKEIDFPAWEDLEKENVELDPKILIGIFNKQGEVIRWIEAKNKKGISSCIWDYRMNPIPIVSESNKNRQRGALVGPGSYSAQLYSWNMGKFQELSEKVRFEVKKIEGYDAALPEQSSEEVVAFWGALEESYTRMQVLNRSMNATMKKVELYKEALERSKQLDNALMEKIANHYLNVKSLQTKVNGSSVRSEIGELNEYPTVYSYLGAVSSGVGNSFYGPTPMHREYLENANKMIESASSSLNKINDELRTIKEELGKKGLEIIEF